ncbi:hypothetical protein [uncultured Akkermansia sp.]|uniref:hypothetical protein n=1 Tax=uncultured Akkermansia sp. TaxID=512294 RepID=UPI0025F9F836|nr:hypothetical protein [uncultured Akkermansia sp.]
MMKKPLLLIAVACCACAVSHVARAQKAEPVNVYVSGVSVSFPDPAGVDDIFNKNKKAVEVVLGFVAPRGCKFVKGGEDSQLEVTDGRGARTKAKFDNFFTRIGDSGAFAKHTLGLEQRPVFPLKLGGVVKMKVSEGTVTLPGQEFDARKGAKFKVEGMEITVKAAKGQGKASGEVELEFNDTLNVEEITLTNAKGGKLEVMGVSKSWFSMGSVPSRTYTYQVKNMPAKMKAAVVVNKGVKTMDIPVKVTVDLSAPAK